MLAQRPSHRRMLSEKVMRTGRQGSAILHCTLEDSCDLARHGQAWDSCVLGVKEKYCCRNGLDGREIFARCTGEEGSQF